MAGTGASAPAHLWADRRAGTWGSPLTRGKCKLQRGWTAGPRSQNIGRRQLPTRTGACDHHKVRLRVLAISTLGYVKLHKVLVVSHGSLQLQMAGHGIGSHWQCAWQMFRVFFIEISKHRACPLSALRKSNWHRWVMH